MIAVQLVSARVAVVTGQGLAAAMRRRLPGPVFAAPRDYWLTTVAVLGTTISPYLFFWQAGQEVEELRLDPAREPILERPSLARAALLAG
jgi:Mn2+/Fe2+ NRAMP family transporter